MLRSRGWFAMFGLVACCGLGTVTGCRTDTDDIERWTTRSQGLRKLVAVLTHDKYSVDLRVEAAMALVRMKPRGGRRVGLLGQDDQVGLIGALESLKPAARARLLDKVIPALIEEMKRPPPKAQAGAAAAADPSFQYKDAAYALFSHNEGALIQSDEQREILRKAMTDWAMTNFADRLDDSSQLYGMEQMLRDLGPVGVAQLPAKITPSAKRIDKMAELIADIGDKKAKLSASGALVKVAKDVDSDGWVQRKKPAVQAANKASKLNPSADQLKAQLEQYQEEELLRTFSSMKKVGGEPAVDYLLAYANNKDKPENRRAAGLAALEGNIDKNNKNQVTAMLDLAVHKDTPIPVRDVALRRVGEFPRNLTVKRLYGLFSSDTWQIRWVAAELVLRTSKMEHLPEFMRKIGRVKGMAITEPLRYGALIGKMKGEPAPSKVIDKYAGRGWAVESRLSALGYYYEYGTKNQLAKVNRYSADRTKVPSCLDDAEDCEWLCVHNKEDKEIATVGDFVKHCVVPAMEQRSEKASKKGKTEGK